MGRSTKRYQNAAQILPFALLQQVQNLAAGLVLYVPYPVTRRDFNRLKVLDLRTQGYSISQIAFRVGITPRAVFKILQNDRERALITLQYLGWGEESETDDKVEKPASGETSPPCEMASILTEELL